jgi:hypothetical protein
VAIIRRAVWDFVLYNGVSKKKDPLQHEMHADAAGWLFWDGEEEVDEEGRLTFRHICDLLDLDPKRIRHLVSEMTREDIQRLNNQIKEG